MTFDPIYKSLAKQMTSWISFPRSIIVCLSFLIDEFVFRCSCFFTAQLEKQFSFRMERGGDKDC